MKIETDSRIVLASSSPRRRELLEMVGIPFEVLPSDVKENIELHGNGFEEFVKTLAQTKAQAVAERVDGAVVIGADTIVVYNGEIYHKPVSPEEAKQFLRDFSGKTHSVYTGVAIWCEGEWSLVCEETKVVFRKLDDELIDWYVDSGDPMDKAGAYGIQTAGALLVERIVGDYYNVVGMPIAKVVNCLRELNLLALQGGDA
ncbi:nucleoside triphosphate pyrophosphatase [Sporosarcina sp. Te-1]|uniref:Maf family protein n=1 Tax=Sporosarcina sp. Te-1 TaxID=2818390 RepID=UPI001A9E9547|nr:Maf family protein [Sporosarcina sp. Te-1]QTD41582.1 septum formation inhibitor Maf [Sporosarcina sp. Te-1]